MNHNPANPPAATPTTEPATAHNEEWTTRPRAIAHDLRQHIATARALAEAALEAPGLPERTSDLIRGILEEASLMTDLCRRLRELDRPRERVALDVVVKELVARRQVGTTIAWRCELRNCAVVGDRIGLVRIVENLIDNAVNAAGCHGCVSVTLRPTCGKTVLSIANSLPRAGSECAAGSGLGLAIVQGLVRAHQGTVVFESDRRQGRARAVVSLPSAAPIDSAVGDKVRSRPTRTVVHTSLAMLTHALVVALRCSGHEASAASSTDALLRDAPAADTIVIEAPSGADDLPTVLRTLRAVAPRARVVLLADRITPELLRSDRAQRVDAVASMADNLRHLQAAIDGRKDTTPRVGRTPVMGKSAIRFEVGTGHSSLNVHSLTDREREVLAALMRGQGTAVIARSMGIAYTTARTHIQNILTKLGAHSKVEAVAIAVREGLPCSPGSGQPAGRKRPPPTSAAEQSRGGGAKRARGSDAAS